MILKTIVNFTLKRTIRRLWDTPPSVENMRKTFADADRLASLGKRHPPFETDCINGTNVEWIGPRHQAHEGVILYLHGGGFAVRGTFADRHFCASLSRRSGRPIVLVPYRLAPEFPFPAGLDDCRNVYAGLVAAGIPAQKIVLLGHSAGANLALAVLMRARREGLDQPAGAILLSAPIDLTAASPSASANAANDCMNQPAIWPWVRQVYLAGTPPDHPDASPMFGNWAGLAPVHFHVSSQELILDDSRRGFECAQRAGTDAHLSVWNDVPHNFYYLDFLSEARRCRTEILGFIERALSVQAVPT